MDPDRTKNIDSHCFVTSFGLFIFENDVNVPSKRNKQKNFKKKNLFSVGILKVNDENSRIRSESGPTDPDPVPDPHKNVMDPRHWPQGNTVRETIER
jgi:hypothetical protein